MTAQESLGGISVPFGSPKAFLLGPLSLYMKNRPPATHLRATENKARNKAFP